MVTVSPQVFFPVLFFVFLLNVPFLSLPSLSDFVVLSGQVVTVQADKNDQHKYYTLYNKRIILRSFCIKKMCNVS